MSNEIVAILESQIRSGETHEAQSIDYSVSLIDFLLKNFDQSISDLQFELKDMIDHDLFIEQSLALVKEVQSLGLEFLGLEKEFEINNQVLHCI